MIALITPTGARPKQISICSKLMKKQTYLGEVLWIIVDDCSPVTTNFINDSFRPGWKIEKIYPVPSWQPGMNTQGRNLIAALDTLIDISSKEEIEAIFIIEDDDYYSADYLSEMVKRIKGYQVAGEMCTIYYNVFTRRWVENKNEEWSSLFQTCFTWDAIPLFYSFRMEKYIDISIFKHAKSKNLFRANNLSIGIKGQPGRPGIGAGHSMAMNMAHDPNGDYLKKLIGTDANLYL